MPGGVRNVQSYVAKLNFNANFKLQNHSCCDGNNDY